MHRLRKLIGMIFIFGIVFFIICDEKGYKIHWQDSHVVFEKNEKKSDLHEDRPTNTQVKLEPVSKYKNSNIIRINPEFQNPKSLYKSDGIDTEYLAKREQQEKVYTGPSVVTLNDSDTIYSVFQGNDIQQNTGTTKKETKQSTGTTKQETKQNTGTTKQETKQNTGITKQEMKQNTATTKQETKQNTGITKQETKQSTGTTKQENKQNTGTVKSQTEIVSENKKQNPVIYYPVKKYKYKIHSLNLCRGVKIEIPTVKTEKYSLKDNLTLSLTKAKETEPVILYKNSHIIRIYSGFENPLNLRGSSGMDEEFLLKQKNSNPTIISLKDTDTIISALEDVGDNNEELEYDTGEYTDVMLEIGTNSDLQEVKNPKDNQTSGSKKDNITVNQEKNNESETTGNVKNDRSEFTGYGFESKEKLDEVENKDFVESGNADVENEKVMTYKVKKYQLETHSSNIKKAAEKISISLNMENIPEEDNLTEENTVVVDKPELSNHSIDIVEGKQIENKNVTVQKYQLSKHPFVLRKGLVVNNIVEENVENGLSDAMLESLLENEEIDIKTLESENDEILQKVFEQTRDTDVMNLIVETYLNEYQFVKAKRFIENLPDMYRNELRPSLNLRVAFNSFSVSSTDVTANLTSLVQDYSAKNAISDEDKNWYLGVIALMSRNYDKFFEISAGFTSEKNKAFTSKLKGYKDQISKQMGMPEYYFDTLVALELFNQGLFQPAKVLALYSLQKNSSYILPYQVLAYANFLTNSWDTSVEYLKKLVDLDPNNAEKYRFLMGVAFYRNEEYEQSVVMLSMIKDDNLRLDTQRYLINDYIKLNQKSKMISTRNKLLGYENLVASDFYTYFYEAFFHPYSEGEKYQIYTSDTELANKMLRVCSITLQDQEKAVCTYGTIGRNIALGQFDGLEQYLLSLATRYPQGYLYQALGDYYIQQGDLEKAKAYLLKAVSLTQKKSERSQIKKLLRDTM